MKIILEKLDYHILNTLILRSWNIVAGGISLLLIPYGFDKVQQGYYYAFAGIIAMQIFFDLGFNSIIVQLVGHEYSHLSKNENGVLTGDNVKLSRFYSIYYLLKHWYLIAGLLFVVFLIPAGYLFFRVRSELSILSWFLPWVLIVIFTGVNLYLSAFLAFTEGQGEVATVAKLRTKQSFCGYVIFWGVLVFHGGLWAAVVIPLINSLMSWVWLNKRYSREILNLKNKQITAKVSWKEEIFPFQWKIALSWISGYFIFSFFTPMIFKHQGPVEAGKIGITLSIFSAISTLGMSWISAKTPNLVMLIAQQRRHELNQLFNSLLIKSIVTTSLICVLFLVATGILIKLDIPLVKRLSNFSTMIYLSLSTIINVSVFSMATYMRAHKQEPMLWNSVCVGILMMLEIWYFSSISVSVVIIIYFLIALLIGLPWTLFLFYKGYYPEYKEINNFFKN